MSTPDPTPAPVLVIEDDEDLRDALLVLLRMNGRPAVGAADGAQALAMLREGLRPCVIVLDLIMRGHSGWEFRAEQLNDPELAGIPTIVVSAAVQGESVRRALQVTAFLPKPLDIDQLLALIDHHAVTR